MLREENSNKKKHDIKELQSDLNKRLKQKYITLFEHVLLAPLNWKVLFVFVGCSESKLKHLPFYHLNLKYQDE